MTRGKRGFTLVEIMIAVGILGLLMAVVVPNFMRARRSASTNICISNLRRINDAKSMLALWEGVSEGDTPGWDDLVPDYIKSTPTCPINGTYSINSIGSNAECTETGHVISA